MKNRLLFLTVAGVLAMPAVAAPAAEWSIYGTLVTEVYNSKITGSTTASNNIDSRWGMGSGTSHIGFKGSMQVADNVKAIWQVESQIFTDGGQDTTKNQGVWANRNSAVGLTGTWGTALLGQWDTPYKAIQVPLTQIRAGVLSDVSILGQKGGIAVATTADYPNNESFKRCQGNSVQYWSPNIEGFQAKLMYSVDEKADATATYRPTLFSGSLSYNLKPANLTIFAAFEQHKDTNLAAGQKDTGMELAAYWIAPTKTRVTAIVEQLKYETAAGVETKRNAWFVSAGHPITQNHKVWGSFGQALNTKKNGVEREDGATQYALGYTYCFNKNAEVYAFYTGVNNKELGNYNLMPPTPGMLKAGGDVRAFGLGVFYTF